MEAGSDLLPVCWYLFTSFFVEFLKGPSLRSSNYPGRGGGRNLRLAFAKIPFVGKIKRYVSAVLLLNL